MKSKSTDFLVILTILYVASAIIILHLGYIVETQNLNSLKEFTDISSKIYISIIKTPFIFLTTLFNIQFTFKIWIIFSVVYFGYGFYLNEEKSKYKKRGIEHGSARWGTIREAKVLIKSQGKKILKILVKNKKTENLKIFKVLTGYIYNKKTKILRILTNHEDNIKTKILKILKILNKCKKNERIRILSKNVRLKLGHKKLFINDNMIVFGSPGTGKTRNFIIPNILELNSNYIVTDTKGTILKNTGYFLKKNGYTIKVLNLVDMAHSNNFNPFHYIKKDEEILALIANIQDNITSGDESKKSGDPFWEDAEKALLCSIFYYIYYELSKEKQNFNEALDCILNFENPESEYLKKINKLAEENPEHLAYVYYKVVILSAEKTRQSILVTASVRLSQFAVEAVRDIVSTDNMDLYALDKKKMAIFVIIPDTTKAFNFIAAMFFTTLFNVSIYMADNKKSEMLDIPLQIFLDEFKSIGKINGFIDILSVIRSRGISAIMILQNLAQLKEMYDKSWGSAIGNCDTLLFLGGTEQALLKYLSETLGKETISRKNRSTSKSKTISTSYSENILASSLITPDELSILDNNKCIISVRLLRPIKDFKFDLEKHKNYKFTRNFNEEYSFYTNERITTKKAIVKKPKIITKEAIIEELKIVTKKVIIENSNNNLVSDDIAKSELIKNLM